jgi:ABC-type multidrug transport system fused ATPase/permease subunit
MTTGSGVASPELRRLWHWGRVVVAGAGWPWALNLGTALGAQTLVQVGVARLAIVVSALSNGRDARQPALVLLAVTLSAVTLAFADRRLTTWTDARMTSRLQQRLHDHLFELGPRWHRAHGLAETTMIGNAYALSAQVVLRDFVGAPIQRGVGLLTALFFLGQSLRHLGGGGGAGGSLRYALLAALVLVPVLGARLVKRAGAAADAVRERELGVSAAWTDTATAPVELGLLGAKALRASVFAERVAALEHAKVASAARSDLAQQFQTQLPVVLQALFLVYGAWVASGPEAAGAILSIFYFVPAAVSPVQQLMMFYAGIRLSWGQVRKVIEMLEAEPDVAEPSDDARALPSPSAPAGSPLAVALALSLEDVRYAYSADAKPVLDGVAFECAAGKVTAIVARSGQGKSSALALACRLDDPQAGRVTLGGVDVRRVPLASLRRAITRIAQDPPFVADTVRENLRLACADATDEALERALRRCLVWESLEKSAPAGQTPLDVLVPRDRNSGPSGGERRRIALARAVLREAPVLLLDEPTTGLDALTRRPLERVVREAFAGRTVVVVDMDLEFVLAVADHVVVLEGGKVAEQGAPRALADAGGLFAKMIAAARGHHALAPSAVPATPAAEPDAAASR